MEKFGRMYKRPLTKILGKNQSVPKNANESQINDSHLNCLNKVVIITFIINKTPSTKLGVNSYFSDNLILHQNTQEINLECFNQT